MDDSRINQILTMAEEGLSMEEPSKTHKLAMKVKDYLSDIEAQRLHLAELDDEATRLSEAIEKRTDKLAEMNIVRTHLLELVHDAEIEAVTAGRSEAAVGLRKKLQAERRTVVEHDSRMEEETARSNQKKSINKFQIYQGYDRTHSG